MSIGYYVSDTPVSKRVDAAWGKGYEAGLRDGRRPWRVLELMGTVYLLFRYGRRLARMGLVFLPWIVILMIVALPPALLFGAVLITTRAIKSHRREDKGRPMVVASVGTINVDGSAGEPF